MTPDIKPPSLDDAIAFSLRYLRESWMKIPAKHTRRVSDFRPSYVTDKWAFFTGLSSSDSRSFAIELSPVFFDAAWELCKRGILRPGAASALHQQPPSDCYTLTEFGRKWIETADESQFVIMQPGPLAETLSGFASRFGEGYNQRTQEAVLCLQVGAWLACCAMVGAAAESILLAVASEKSSDEDNTIKIYEGAGGRQKLTEQVVANLKDYKKADFRAFMKLLSFWRDASAHGQATDISHANAHEAIRQLLALSQWADRYWNELTV